ncbi:MAG: proline--tRNA ligase, partial [Bacteriovoracia bacterium]
LCISPTNEEAITDVFRKSIKSYKELPVTLYQINTKFRDEIRPRYGLMRAREFTMKDAYSFHIDKASLDEVYQNLYKVYQRVFERMGLNYIVVEADPGAMASGDAQTHEFQVVADSGEDEVIYNEKTGYAANIEKAQTRRSPLDFSYSKDAIEKIATPGRSSIEDVCAFLNLPPYHDLKALLYVAIKGEGEKAKEEMVMALLLGDDSLNEIKLKNYLRADHLLPANDVQINAAGFDKGFIGPYEAKSKKIKVIYDKAIDLDASYIIGAYEDHHYKNFIPTRDDNDIESADMRMSKAGDFVMDVDEPVEIKKGIEVGHIFQLGDKYTKNMGVSVLDSNGKAATPLMGCYGIGITRIVSAAIEQSHDENGIIWPKALAPYQVHFTTIAKSEETINLANDIYDQLVDAGIDVLFDDRKMGPGFKFKDADLLGLPLRLVLGERDFKKDGMLEVKMRKTGESFKIKPEHLVEKINSLLTLAW